MDVQLMTKHNPDPVLMIVLDAAEPRLIEQWMNDGKLPALKSLRSKGEYCRVKSLSAKLLAGSPWPTFYTGTTPADHGIYESTQWNAKKMNFDPVNPDWLPLKPFYRQLGEDIRVISVDAPLTYFPEPFNGIEICSWLTYDSLFLTENEQPVSYPTTEIDRLREQFGLEPFSISSEGWGLQRIKSLIKVGEQLVQATLRTGDLAKTLITTEKWDLFLLALAAPHRGGHKLWDVSGTYGHLGSKDQEEFSHLMENLYVACDKVVEQLIETTTENTRIIVCSLHGMKPNTKRPYILPKILPHILAKNSKDNQVSDVMNASFQEKVKELVPKTWRSIANINESLPYKLISLVKPNFDNNIPNKISEPAFVLPSDLNGYIRINLRGREKDGVVEPGEEYTQLCTTIIDDLKTLTDAETGQPVIEQIFRIDELFESGARLKYLPDLIVKWKTSPAINQKRIVSDRFPSLSISPPNRNLDGRSGNHGSDGFFIGVGVGMSPNSKINSCDILDLAPTICALLGVQKPNQMHGHSIWTVDSKTC